jgi:hypothetical protein
VSVNPIFPEIFQGGQMTDLPVFSGTFNGTELFEVVAAPTGQTVAAGGVNYSITTTLLAALLAQLGASAVIITDGQYTNPASPYVPGPSIARIYVNKVVASPTYIQLAAASSYVVEPLITDTNGTVDGAGNGITVTFTGGEQADGIASIPINTPYAGYFFRPIGSLNKWHLGVG